MQELLKTIMLNMGNGPIRLEWSSRQRIIVPGTAGMWSTAEDYFKLCQMMLNKGEFNG